MEEEEKYSKQIIPIFKREVINVFLRDIRRRKTEGEESLKKYCKELAEKIAEEEPYLAYLLNEFIKITPKERKTGFIQGLSVCYELIRRQTEISSLEENLNRKEEK